jgi:hypothetical protein
MAYDIPSMYSLGCKLTIQEHRVYNHQVQHCVFYKARRAKLKGGKLMASDAKDPKIRDGLLDGTYGFREFAALKGSPAYWQKAT